MSNRYKYVQYATAKTQRDQLKNLKDQNDAETKTEAITLNQAEKALNYQVNVIITSLENGTPSRAEINEMKRLREIYLSLKTKFDSKQILRKTVTIQLEKKMLEYEIAKAELEAEIKNQE